MQKSVTGLLKIRRVFKRFFSLERFPDLLSNQHYPSYPNRGYEIEQLQPDYVDNGFKPSPAKPRDERSRL